jgi:hypothetical protein
MDPGAIEPSSTVGAPPVTVWAMPSGETVSYEVSSRRLIILGPAGQMLKQDIDLRERGDFVSLDQ